MASHTSVTDRILGAIQRTHGCDLDTLTSSLSDLSWGQVFLEIDRLSREGQVLVTLDTGGRYMIRLPDYSKEPVPHHIRSWSTKGSQGIAK
jgi:predicted  nucleic acid-binding Zn-ribbon protein